MQQVEGLLRHVNNHDHAGQPHQALDEGMGKGELGVVSLSCVVCVCVCVQADLMAGSSETASSPSESSWSSPGQSLASAGVVSETSPKVHILMIWGVVYVSILSVRGAEERGCPRGSR